MEVIHCQVNENSSKSTPGHWFFHTGRWVVCAEATKSGKNHWKIELHYVLVDKEVPSGFKTLTELKTFLANYYELDVVRGSLPEEDDI